jgi:hypothetical protein
MQIAKIAEELRKVVREVGDETPQRTASTMDARGSRRGGFLHHGFCPTYPVGSGDQPTPPGYAR